MITRKRFVSMFATMSIGLVSGISKAYGISESEPFSKELVKEFVIAGHSDIIKVKEMLREFPTLLNCSYDWGDGDFEMAIEGAGHVGNDAMAHYLIKMGARPNIFTFTMLGHVEIVKMMLEVYPDLLWSKGPHGFSLYHHARIAVKNADQLEKMISTKGLEKIKFD